MTQEAAQEANQENDPTPVPITKSSAGLTKRQVRMNSDVRVLYDDGDSTLEMLCLDDKGTAGAKKVTKPQAKQVPVVDASQAPAIMECNQQWILQYNLVLCLLNALHTPINGLFSYALLRQFHLNL